MYTKAVFRLLACSESEEDRAEPTEAESWKVEYLFVAFSSQRFKFISQPVDSDHYTQLPVLFG
jgi:hypothetical protein